MSLISVIREYILGPPLQFHHQKNTIQTINAQFNNPKFFYFFLLISIICFIAIIIRIFRLKRQTHILPFVVCAILIYSGYVLEKSFRVGIDMDQENPLKMFIGSSGMTKSPLMGQIMKFKDSNLVKSNVNNENKDSRMNLKSVDTLNVLNNNENSRMNLKPMNFLSDNVDKQNKSENLETGKNKKVRKFILVPQDKTEDEIDENKENNVTKKKNKFIKDPKKKNKPDIGKNTKRDHKLNEQASNDDSVSNIEDNIKLKKAEETYNDTMEQNDFIESLKNAMNRKESAITKAKELLINLKKIKNFIYEDLDGFESNFNDFVKNSKKFKDLLAKADISPELYKIDLEDLKSETKKRLEITDILEKFIKTTKTGSNIIDKIKDAFSASKDKKENLFNIDNFNNSENNFLEPLVINQIKPEKSNFLKNFFKPNFTSFLVDKKENNSNKNNEKSEFAIQEIENLTAIQIFMVVQGIMCLIIFILMICNILDIIPACKLLLLFVLIGNVFIGVISMIYSQELAKRCLTMDVPFCQKRNLFDVEEVVDILNENSDSKSQNSVQFIENKFSENYDTLIIIVENLQTYMEGNFSQVTHKIDIFRNMINKLTFVESNLNKPDNLFSSVYTMKRFLEDFKHQIQQLDNKSLFPIYVDLLESEIFFRDQKDKIKNKIENFLKLNMKRKGDKANDECRKQIKKICRAKKDYEQLAFALIVFGLIFVILVCF